MKKVNLKKLTITALMAAVAVVGSLFSFPVFGSKCAPVQHLVNILCVVTVGPWWTLAQAFIASLIRNLIGLGSPLAFPGSMFGALVHFWAAFCINMERSCHLPILVKW